MNACMRARGGEVAVTPWAWHTFARLSWLAGLTMSSVPGDMMSLMLSSPTWFSCSSSSICGGVSPASSQCVQLQAIPRCDRCGLCHCYQQAKDRQWQDMGWEEQGGQRYLKILANPLALAVTQTAATTKTNLESRGIHTYLKRPAQMGLENWASLYMD
jgi:hypothetical protein